MEKKLVRVPFEVGMAKKITSGEVEGRIVTRDGRSVRIVCWDKINNDYPVIGLVETEGKEENYDYTSKGEFVEGNCRNLDLMLEIPEYTTFKDGDVLHVKVNDGNQYIFIYLNNGKDKTFIYAALDDEGTLFIEKNRITYNDDISELRFATEEEKQKLITALKESKKPKAKEYLKRFFGIEQKQEYEFKPFDKVLVRDDKDECWRADIFSHKDKNDEFFPWFCIGVRYKYCIPYNEKTKHLLGTTKNWEE